MLTLASSLWLPSLYFLTEGHIADASTLTLIRLDRVLPATLLFILMIYTLVRITISRQPQPNP
jgi:branched-subunit amino acid transport protein AzlD